MTETTRAKNRCFGHSAVTPWHGVVHCRNKTADTETTTPKQRPPFLPIVTPSMDPLLQQLTSYLTSLLPLAAGRGAKSRLEAVNRCLAGARFRVVSSGRPGLGPSRPSGGLRDGRAGPPPPPGPGETGPGPATIIRDGTMLACPESASGRPQSLTRGDSDSVAAELQSRSRP